MSEQPCRGRKDLGGSDERRGPRGKQKAESQEWSKGAQEGSATEILNGNIGGIKGKGDGSKKERVWTYVQSSGTLNPSGSIKGGARGDEDGRGDKTRCPRPLPDISKSRFEMRGREAQRKS